MIRKFAYIAAGLIFIFTFSVCRQKPDTENTESVFLNHNDTVSYTGISSCQPCHADKYETFIQTGMGLSFDSASGLKSSAYFNNVKPVYDAYKDLYYLPLLRNNNLYIKEYRLFKGDTVYARTEKISYIIGSGHHTNSHLVRENGYLFQAPLTFYTQKGRWDLPPGFENGNNTGFTRKIGMECMSCHNALPETDASAENRYLNLPHGISCERCHGPGELHISEKKKGNVVDISSETDYTIVNPRKLSWQRQIDICQRCHLQGNAVLKPGKNFGSFRPGMVLSETFDQFSPVYEDGEDFVMAAHAERFQQSKCFTAGISKDPSKGNPAFTCISCHDPHVSVRQTNTLKFNKTCNSCHSDKNSVKCSESEKKQAASQHNCVSCHMPVSGTGDIPHVSVHDHFIRKPSGLPYVKPSKLKGLKCVTSSKPDIQTETEAYISYYEKFDANKFYLNKAIEKSKELNSKNLEHLQTLIHLYYINKEYNKITEQSKNYNGSDAWTNYRIAKAFENRLAYSDAGLYYLRALEVQGSNLDFLLQYAILLIKSKDWKKAELSLNKYNSLYAKTADAWAYLGLVKMNERNYSEAAKCFNKALSLDPDQITALRNLKIIYALSGDKAKEASVDAALKRVPAAAKNTVELSKQ